MELMSHRRKIAILTTDMYKGGVAESTRKLVKVLSKQADVDLIIYDNTPVNISTQAKRTILLNLPLATNFAKTRFGRFLKKTFRPLGLLCAIIYLIFYRLKYKPDVIYSLLYIPNLANILAASAFKDKTKIIISERQDPRMDLDADSLLVKILRWAYPRADLIHANSYEMIDAIQGFYYISKSKIIHLDNFFFLNEIVSLGCEVIPIEHEFIFKDKVIISSGRLSKQKGHWHLLNALKILTDIDEDYTLVILGDGELDAELKSIAKKLGIEKRVFFLGNVDNPHKYISRSHVFVFPSIWESFGNSLVEAMALSIPVISTSCQSGPGYIIGHGKYGQDLGVLPDYSKINDEVASDVAAKKIVNSIIQLIDVDIYNKYKSLGAERAKHFSCEMITNQLGIMFFGNK